MPARYGGEEFTVVLPNTNPLGANVVAERIRRAFESSETTFESKTLKVTMSLGVASAQAPTRAPWRCSPRAPMRRCNTAKRGGRNRVATATLAPVPATIASTTKTP